ncbi:MAG TPA: chemotaxis protein CheW [Burkholderiaceae bacterium]|nr:chemotaxis protein CheW [Burkholderiaceae bacterium]
MARLDLRWEVIETTARIVCPREATGFLQTLAATRASFSQLAAELVERIAEAHHDNRLRDLSSRAQVAIDILVRNLFERTADVGFIATDSPLVAFVRAPGDAGARELRARLAEYRAKYTVYSDIVVLSTDGRVLVRLADADGHCDDLPDWWPTMLRNAGHVERYERSPLFDGEQAAHYFAHRIVDAGGTPIGAVLLRFDLASELASVFEDLTGDDRDIAIVFADAERRAIASSRPHDIAPGHRLDRMDGSQVLSAGGHDWLAQARGTRGYQGYLGLGWQAVALIRLDAAFRERDTAAHGIAAQLRHDDTRLAAIVAQARKVEEGLHRVVWNGKLARTDDAAASSLHAVFDQIAGAGRQTTALFHEAIAALKALLRDGRCAQLAFHASLAVRMVDRNLYERANDCRWWALSPDLAAPLAALNADPTDDAARQTAERVLAHLNGLYTVYRRIALFDTHGRVVAVSRDDATLPAGLHLEPALVQQVLGLRSTADYAVSRFAASALADGAPTYVYAAAVRGPAGDVLGGVALAFASDVEMPAMLKDALPDGEALEAWLVDPHGSVIAATANTCATGQPLPFAPPAELAGATARAVPRDGATLLAGTALSEGYREFKRSDGYVEPVRAWIFHGQPLEPAEAATSAGADIASASRPGERRLAVVSCGSLLLGFDADDVVEAVSAQRLLDVARGGIGAGMLEVTTGHDKRFVAAVDMGAMCGEPRAAGQDGVAVIVRQRGDVEVALLVDRLVHVIECGNVQPPPAAVALHSAWVHGIARVSDASNEMIYLVDPRRIATAHRTTDGAVWA